MSTNRRLVAVVSASAAALIGATFAAPNALANTRNNAGSYMNRAWNLSTPYSPGSPSGFIVGKGVTIWMDCFESGPNQNGTSKWFEITVNNNGGHGYGTPGMVPATAVSNQWNASPHC